MTVYVEDKRLVKRLLAGDERAFDRFFDENFARLYRFALTRLSDDPEAARDIAQKTLSRALNKLTTYKAEAALFTWLCAICRNVTNDWVSQQARYRQHIVLTEDFPDVRAAVDSLPALPDTYPERNYQRIELLRLIQVALDRLPAKYGDVLEWKYIEGYSVKEISAKLDIGTEATQSLLARARRAFSEVYSSMTAAIEQQDNEWVRL
jgi:RNA polymerase sigma-70 factor (ECF subfamily)